MQVTTICIPNSCSEEARNGKRIYLKAEAYDAFYGWPADDKLNPTPLWRWKSGIYEGPIGWPKPFWRRVGT